MQTNLMLSYDLLKFTKYFFVVSKEKHEIGMKDKHWRNWCITKKPALHQSDLSIIF